MGDVNLICILIPITASINTQNTGDDVTNYITAHGDKMELSNKLESLAYIHSVVYGKDECVLEVISTCNSFNK